jgi:hypothetical protein
MGPSQIRTLGFVLAVAVSCCGDAVARERPATTPAARFVQDTVDRALGLVRPPVSADAGAELSALIDDSMDWASLTRFAIGRYEAELGAAEMAGVTETLAQRLEALCRRAGAELPSMTVAIRGMRIDPDGSRRILGIATVPKFGEVEVEWTLAKAERSYRIADIKALGLTLRQFLRGWVTSLVAAEGGNAAAVFGQGGAASPQ